MKPARLEKQLGLWDVYAIATGATLSSGFFLLPGLAAAGAGPAMPLSYLLAALIDFPETRAILPYVIADLHRGETAWLEQHPQLRQAGLQWAAATPCTYPRWQPRRAIDHVLVAGGLQLRRVQVPLLAVSDHCPLSAEVAN